MNKIKMKNACNIKASEAFDRFVISKQACGLKEVTIRNYRNHYHSISKFFDWDRPLCEVTEDDLDRMISDMREAGLAHNSISSYLRVFVTFLTWCRGKGFTDLVLKNWKQEETVKETYTDEELITLLKHPPRSCTFRTFRSWVIINFLIDSGCRAATVRNIHNSDVSLERCQIIFRHMKGGKVQVIPISSRMIVILREYMRIRGGEGNDFLFCDEYGGPLSENALRLSIASYNRSRGIEKTSIHLFRHTFARKYLLDCGGNAFTLQKILGHSTLKMTKHYCSIYDADIAKNYDSFSPLASMNPRGEKIRK